MNTLHAAQKREEQRNLNQCHHAIFTKLRVGHRSLKFCRNSGLKDFVIHFSRIKEYQNKRKTLKDEGLTKS